MTSVASQRLIEASATLEPADRALLNLLVNHGLDDGAVARLTRATGAEIASRREKLVEDLSTALGLPPAIVRDALDELTTSAPGQASATAPAVKDGNHLPDTAIAATDADLGNASSNDPAVAASSHAPAAAAATAETPEPAASSPSPAPAAETPAPAASSRAPAPPAETPAPAASSRARVSRRGALGLLAGALAIAVALVVILTPGNAKHESTAARKLTTAPVAARPAPPPAQPAPPTAQPPPRPAVPTLREQGALAGLPGGPTGVTGSLAIVGPPSRKRLELTVSGLPSAGRSHYELWLYNSIIDAVPLARLRAPRAQRGVPLPRDFHRYRWLDISLQPPRSVNHSGESIVRAAVP